MNLSLLGNIGIGLLLLVYVGYRQTTWRTVDAARMLRTPVILGILGVYSLVRATGGLTAFDIAVLGIELALTAGVGAWMGALAHFRRVDAAASGGSRYESRTGWWGLALWLVVIVVRVGVDAVATRMGSHLATSTGVILLLFAVNRGIRAAVLSARVARLEPLAGRREVA